MARCAADSFGGSSLSLLQDRELMVMGPVFQEVVDVVDRAEESNVFRIFQSGALQERVGSWIRCQNGWLPLAIGAA